MVSQKDKHNPDTDYLFITDPVDAETRFEVPLNHWDKRERRPRDVIERGGVFGEAYAFELSAGHTQTVKATLDVPLVWLLSIQTLRQVCAAFPKDPKHFLNTMNWARARSIASWAQLIVPRPN